MIQHLVVMFVGGAPGQNEASWAVSNACSLFYAARVVLILLDDSVALGFAHEGAYGDSDVARAVAPALVVGDEQLGELRQDELDHRAHHAVRRGCEEQTGVLITRFGAARDGHSHDCGANSDGWEEGMSAAYASSKVRRCGY
uniref:Uncharacterized protein n=1 Tax=Chrysotila carterae TaxID=13221 RepID=A0A6S9RRQ8_CHRCT|eukprot:6213643-Pleurochrysis_carterae.AAC.2